MSSGNSVLNYRAAKWCAPDIIECEIFVRGRWLPFAASAGDTETHGRELFAVLAEKLGPYITPEQETTNEGPE